MGVLDVSTNLLDYVPSVDAGSSLGAGTSADLSGQFDPSGITPGAQSWTDIFKYGIGRLADYKIASLQAQQQGAQVAPTQSPIAGQTGSLAQSAQGASMNGMLLLAVIGLVVWKLAG